MKYSGAILDRTKNLSLERYKIPQKLPPTFSRRVAETGYNAAMNLWDEPLFDPLVYLAMALGLWALAPKSDRWTLGRLFLVIIGLVWLGASLLGY